MHRELHLAKLTQFFKDDQFGRKQLSQFGRTDALYIQLQTDRSGRPFLTNGEHPTATLIWGPIAAYFLVMDLVLLCATIIQFQIARIIRNQKLPPKLPALIFKHRLFPYFSFLVGKIFDHDFISDDGRNGRQR